MAKKKVWIGGIGPFLYDDGTVTYGLETDGEVSFSSASPTLAALTLTGLTASKLVATTAAKLLTSLAALAAVADIAAATVAALTDNSGGSKDNTVQALTDPADAPATPDALRDDLVANLIPELRNNFAELTEEVNALVTDIADVRTQMNLLLARTRTHGLIAT